MSQVTSLLGEYAGGARGGNGGRFLHWTLEWLGFPFSLGHSIPSSVALSIFLHSALQAGYHVALLSLSCFAWIIVLRGVVQLFADLIRPFKASSQGTTRGLLTMATLKEVKSAGRYVWVD